MAGIEKIKASLLSWVLTIKYLNKKWHKKKQDELKVKSCIKQTHLSKSFHTFLEAKKRKIYGASEEGTEVCKMLVSYLSSTEITSG